MYGTCRIDIYQYYHNSEFISGFFSWKIVKFVFVPPVLTPNEVSDPKMTPKVSKFSNLTFPLSFCHEKPDPYQFSCQRINYWRSIPYYECFGGILGAFSGHYDVITAWNFNFSTFWRYYCLYYSSNLTCTDFQDKKITSWRSMAY